MSWDRLCPIFIEACKCLEATDPEHMFKYFPSQDTLMWEKDAGPAGTMEADWHEGYRPGAPCANDWAAPSMQPIPGDTHNRLENTELETTASQGGLIAESQPWQQATQTKTGPMLPAGSRDWMSPL